MNKPLLVISSLLISIGFAVALLIPSSANAVLSSCSASVSPTTSQPNVSEKSFSFTVSNTSGQTAWWFKITKPSSDMTFGPISLSGWEKNISGDSVTFQSNPNSIGPGESINPVIGLNIGDLAGFSGNWTVEASDDFDGISPTNCGGSLDLTISGAAPDADAPEISAISVTEISSTSAKISWQTNELSTSKVKYDVNEEADIYPFVHEDSSLTTSHSITVTTSIAPGTTYYYKVCSTDATGNEGCAGENSFITATATSAGSSTTTSTTTVTTTPSTVTEIVLVQDKAAPSIIISTDFEKPFTQAPNITGIARDTSVSGIDPGIIAIDYSIDDGKNWLPVDSLESVKGKGESEKAFSFTPAIFDDGNYKIKARARDPSGNIGTSITYELVIDRLPPQVGGALFSIGPQILVPDASGIVYTLANLSQKITLSSVGGALSIELITDDQNFPLNLNADSGLWSGMINFAKAKTHTLLAKSIDGADNQTQRQLNSVVVLENGLITNGENPISDATISVYYFDPTSLRFILWDAVPYFQQNPQQVENDGKYKLLLPAGKYYLQISAPGFKSLKTNIFTLDQSLPINTNFTLEQSSHFQIGGLKIPLFDFGQTTAKINLNFPQIPNSAKIESNLKNAQLQNFTLKEDAGDINTVSLQGKPTVMTILNTWSPQTSQQLSIMDNLPENSQILTLGVISQETSSKVTVLKKRGSYKTRILADPDGELIENLNLHSTPTHLFINRKGVITNVKVGVLTEDELISNLIN
jgi:hypothetical protein